MKLIKKLSRVLISASVLSALFLGHASAQGLGNYPGSQPVKIVVGYNAGGFTDTLARLLAKAFSEEFEGTFIVENKPGANSNIASGYVARAKPDGHTLLMVAFGFPLSQYMYKDVPYDYKKDFAPIVIAAKVPNVIVVSADSPVQNVKQYVAQSISSKEPSTYATPGVGSSTHLAAEMFKDETKARLLHIPYNGSSSSLKAVMAGETDSGFDNFSAAAPFIKAGKLRALAVTSKDRSNIFPEVPTVAESGFPNYELDSYFGLVAPAGTPTEIIDHLNRTALKALRSEEMSTYLKDLGAFVEDNTPEQFAAFLDSEAKRWSPVIKAAGLEPN